MRYTHKVVSQFGVQWLCCLYDGCFYYKTDYGDCGSFKTGMTSIEAYYPEAEGYVVTKLKHFTGNT